MVGRNELRLNGATMVEAVQVWLDQITTHEDIKVTNVQQRDDMFIVDVEPNKAPETLVMK